MNMNKQNDRDTIKTIEGGQKRCLLTRGDQTLKNKKKVILKVSYSDVSVTQMFSIQNPQCINPTRLVMKDNCAETANRKSRPPC